MKVKLTRYSKVGDTRRRQDKTAQVEWEIMLTKDGYINIQIETGHVYTRKIEMK